MGEWSVVTSLGLVDMPLAWGAKVRIDTYYSACAYILQGSDFFVDR